MEIVESNPLLRKVHYSRLHMKVFRQVLNIFRGHPLTYTDAYSCAAQFGNSEHPFHKCKASLLLFITLGKYWNSSIRNTTHQDASSSALSSKEPTELLSC